MLSLLCSRYHICGHFVKPLTTRDRCSWVELVATGPQSPTWFISHWWGTPFSQTLEMLSWHGEVHKLKETDAYWYCTLANVSGIMLCFWWLIFACLQNQHDLRELGGGLHTTPFWKAIAANSCVGAVQVMDNKCTPPTRVWCVLEVQPHVVYFGLF